MTDETEVELAGAVPRRHPKPKVDKVGGRKLKPSTLMMGHGYDPMLSEGSLKPPIFLTSTFVFPNAAAGKRHFEGVTGKRPGGADGLVYSRFNGPNQEILEDRLGVWEDAE
ncbi:MAG: PLP-dependent transferase, partial [Sphingomonas sp.]|nr:PLP-dependent transferase [Sphingomonas sp.]